MTLRTNTNSLQWYGEIRQHGPNTPVLLVGTKVDKKDDPEVLEKLRMQKQEPVSEAQAKKLAKEIGAVSYLTCSAKFDSGIQTIFEEVVRTVVNAKMGKKSGKQCWSINCRKTLPAVSGPKKVLKLTTQERQFEPPFNGVTVRYLNLMLTR